jgi:hypothetical protein
VPATLDLHPYQSDWIWTTGPLEAADHARGKPICLFVKISYKLVSISKGQACRYDSYLVAISDRLGLKTAISRGWAMSRHTSDHRSIAATAPLRQQTRTATSEIHTRFLLTTSCRKKDHQRTIAYINLLNLSKGKNLRPSQSSVSLLIDPGLNSGHHQTIAATDAKTR